MNGSGEERVYVSGQGQKVEIWGGDEPVLLLNLSSILSAIAEPLMGIWDVAQSPAKQKGGDAFLQVDDWVIGVARSSVSLLVWT